MSKSKRMLTDGKTIPNIEEFPRLNAVLKADKSLKKAEARYREAFDDLVKHCKHELYVQLYSEYRGSYSYDYDDAHDAAFRCLICGASNLNLQPISRLEIYHMIDGRVPSYYIGRKEEDKYKLVHRLFGFGWMANSTLEERIKYVKENGHPVWI